MNAKKRYINVFLSGLALVGTANLSLAAPDTGLLRDLPGSIATGSENAEMPAGETMPGKAPQARPNFTGLWSLNVDASDNPQEKLKKAMQATRQNNGGGRGMGGDSGGMGRGMGGGGRRSPDRMCGRGMH